MVKKTVTRYKVSTRGDRWKHFTSKDEALAYEAMRRAKDGIFRAVVAYQVNA